MVSHPPDNASCSLCAYWHQVAVYFTPETVPKKEEEKHTAGECRRNAPAAREEYHGPNHAETRGDYWCGEFLRYDEIKGGAQ